MRDELNDQPAEVPVLTAVHDADRAAEASAESHPSPVEAEAVAGFQIPAPNPRTVPVRCGPIARLAQLADPAALGQLLIWLLAKVAAVGHVVSPVVKLG